MDTERQRCCCPFVYSIMLISSLLVAKREVEIFPSIWIHLKAFFFSFSPKHLLFYSKYSTNYASHPCAVEFIVYTLCLTRKQDAHFIRCLTWIRKIPIRSNGKKCPAPLDLPCSSWIFPASKRWWDGDNFCLPYPTLNVYVCVLYCLQNKQLALIYYYSHCFSFP